MPSSTQPSNEGVSISDVVRLRRGLTSEWEAAKEPETLCLWAIRAIDAVEKSLTANNRGKGADLLEGSCVSWRLTFPRI